MEHIQRAPYPRWPLTFGIGGVNIGVFAIAYFYDHDKVLGRITDTLNAHPALSWWQDILWMLPKTLQQPFVLTYHAILRGREPDFLITVAGIMANCFLWGFAVAYLINIVAQYWNLHCRRREKTSPGSRTP